MTNSKFNSIEEFEDIPTIDQYKVAIKEGGSEEETLEIVNIYSRDGYYAAKILIDFLENNQIQINNYIIESKIIKRESFK
jgi:hypothetical protein